MTHGEKAKAYFEQGYNCAQAVTLAFADEMGLDEDSAAKLASSFGGGLGRLREVCGCVSGMALAAGAMYGYSDPKARGEGGTLRIDPKACRGIQRKKWKHHLPGTFGRD